MEKESVLVFKSCEVEPWATISSDGKITKFDNITCRQLASEWDDGNKSKDTSIAKLVASILDESSKQVDHVAKPWCWTQGDLIRGFSI